MHIFITDFWQCELQIFRFFAKTPFFPPVSTRPTVGLFFGLPLDFRPTRRSARKFTLLSQKGLLRTLECVFENRAKTPFLVPGTAPHAYALGFDI